MIARAGGLVVVALALAACGPAVRSESGMCSTQGGDKTVSAAAEVELDIFSGNPNPTWRLSDADTALFLRKIAALQGKQAEQLAANLGYRGFVVRVGPDTDQTQARVQRGTVQLTHGSATTHCADPGREVERWLLNSGKPSLKSDLVGLVEAELAK